LIHSDLEGAISIIRDAYLTHARGQSVNPSSVFLRFPDKPNARIIALPSHLEDPWHLSGIKWIASYPDNIRSGVPRASAVLILNSHESGYPFACLEASIISAARTAASAVLAAEHLVADGRRARTLAIVGTGLIARYIYRFLSGTGWNIDRVLLYDINPAEAERFAARVCAPGQHSSVSVAPDLASALGAADLAVFATVAPKPHVHDPALLAHRPVILHISLRDLAPELLLDAYNVVDDVDHVMHADTSPHLAEKLTGSRAFVAGTLADVMQGLCPVDHNRPVIFSPFGLGLLDLALGKWVYDRAVQQGEHCAIGDFFYDLER
jgi:N-[(2S)-2-amino-2-carboxyethyl]-L-glutamate dehydrogenase